MGSIWAFEPLGSSIWAPFELHLSSIYTCSGRIQGILAGLDDAGTLPGRCQDDAGTLPGRWWGTARTMRGRCKDDAGTLPGRWCDTARTMSLKKQEIILETRHFGGVTGPSSPCPDRRAAATLRTPGIFNIFNIFIIFNMVFDH